MPKQSNSNLNSAQAKKLRELQKQLSKAKAAVISARSKQKEIAAKKKVEKLSLNITLERAVASGIYKPKDKTLTKYRKKRLRQINREFGEFFDVRKFVFIPAPKTEKKKILSRASGLDYKTTREGFFLPTQNYGKLKLKKDSARDEWYIERTGKTKWGENKGRRYKSITPLASVDELDKEKNRIRKLAKKLGPLTANQRLSFEIIEKGNEGFSHATFQDIDLLLDYLDQYRKTTAAKLQFYRHINIVKTESISKWFNDHPVKAPKRFSRRIHTKVNVKGRNV